MTISQTSEAGSSGEWLSVVDNRSSAQRQSAVERRQRAVRVVRVAMIGLVGFTALGLSLFAFRRHDMQSDFAMPAAALQQVQPAALRAAITPVALAETPAVPVEPVAAPVVGAPAPVKAKTKPAARPATKKLASRGSTFLKPAKTTTATKH